MRAVVQRVLNAGVTVDGECVGKIGRGYLVLLGVGHGDTRAEADKLWGKLRGLRINEDDNGKTNLALADVDGEVLVVSQFTLFADCRHGRRPSFTDAGAPDVANELYEYFLTLVRQDVEHVAHGIFGADMKVDLVNDGSASASVLNWSQTEVGEQFTSGKAAMVVDGPWLTTTFDNADVNWAVAEIPVPHAGDTAIAPLGGEVWTIPQTGDLARQKKAAELLSALLSADEQLGLNTTRYTIPTNPAVDSDYLEQLPEMESLVNSVNNGRARTAKLGDAWPRTAEALYNAIQSALTGQASPIDALTTAKADHLS